MPAVRTVALLGLPQAGCDVVIRILLGAPGAERRYVMAERLDTADLLIADADHAPSVQLVLATERLGATLFVGRVPPPGAVACLSWPLDPDALLRELDFLVAAPRGLAGAHLQKVAASRWKGEERRPRVHPSVAPKATPPSALLIDDQLTALRDLDERLSRWRLQTEHALTSSRAIERLSQRHFDLIFLDVDLGNGSQGPAGLDGLALCRHIKRRASGVQSLQTAVFLLSTHGGELDRVRGMLAGCDACLPKPPPDADLQRLLLQQGLVLREDAPAG